MASAAPASTSRIERIRLARSPSTTPSIVPRIGIISGATIIAPITVAVESATTPAEAMTEARASRIQNRLNLRLASGPSKKTESRIRSMSLVVTLVLYGTPGSSHAACSRMQGRPFRLGTSGARSAAACVAICRWMRSATAASPKAVAGVSNRWTTRATAARRRHRRPGHKRTQRWRTHSPDPSARRVARRAGWPRPGEVASVVRNPTVQPPHQVVDGPVVEILYELQWVRGGRTDDLGEVLRMAHRQ